MVDEIKPRKIRLEAATICQLRCPSCPTAKGRIRETIGAGFLKFEDFKKLIDNNSWIRNIELSNWGEIFLNPELSKIIEYAHLKHIALHADNGANLNTASDDVLESLVKYGFRSITCSIDGASNATYEIYRIKGNFEAVIKNIKKINSFKAKYRSKWPILKWQFIAFGHNEHETSIARKMAKDLKMSFYVKLSWDDMYFDQIFSPIKNKDRIKKETGLDVSSRSEYHEKYGNNYLQKTICSQLWREPQINWNGQVLGCCVNYWGDLGNAFDQGLFNSLNNEKINYARQMLLGRVTAREDIPCTSCIHYTAMRKDGLWLTMYDIKKQEILDNDWLIWVINKVEFFLKRLLNMNYGKLMKKHRLNNCDL